MKDLCQIIMKFPKKMVFGFIFVQLVFLGLVSPTSAKVVSFNDTQVNSFEYLALNFNVSEYSDIKIHTELIEGKDMTIVLFDYENYLLWKNPATWEKAENILYKANFTGIHDYEAQLEAGDHVLVFYNLWGSTSVTANLVLTITPGERPYKVVEPILVVVYFFIATLVLIYRFHFTSKISNKMDKVVSDNSDTLNNICSKCYSTFSDDAKFCDNCGTKRKK